MQSRCGGGRTCIRGDAARDRCCGTSLDRLSRPFALWLELLAFLPPIRQRRMARDRSFLMADPITAERKHRDDSIESHFAAIKQAAVKKKAAILSSLNDRRVALDTRKSAALERRRMAEAAQAKINSAFLSWQGSLKGGFESMLDVSLDALNDQLDVMLRARMFPLADWYWTGRWILEMRDRLRTGKVDKKSRAPLEAKYRRFAKLSPCLVSNFHMAPAFFTAWQGEDIPFWNAIDLLIVDEAGAGFARHRCLDVRACETRTRRRRHLSDRAGLE